MPQQTFHALTLVDPANPIPVDWLEGAGIDLLYTGAPIPCRTDGSDSSLLPPELRDGWQRLEAFYAGTGIRVLIMSNYYSHNPPGTNAVDVSGRSIDMACLHSDAFYDWMRRVIEDQARAYAAYDVFGGFVFDDGWGTRVDCCYCETCRKRFTEQSGKQPPAFVVQKNSATIADDDVRLQWDQFQRQAYDRYVRVQADAVRCVSDDLLMVTIPADSYFYGRLLNANVPRQDLPKKPNALLQRIERLQVKHWRLYQSFPLPRLPESGESGLQPWGVGIHITSNSPKLVLRNEGPFLQHQQRMQMMSPEEIQQMIRLTLAEGARHLCYWCPGTFTAHYPDGFKGMAAVAREAEQIRSILRDRTEYPAKIGLFYSTTTEILQQPWERNTSERWMHLHSFEATAWAMLRGNVWHRIILEDEISQDSLADVDILIMPSVRFITNRAKAVIEEAATDGLTVLSAGPGQQIADVVLPDYDVTLWHRRIRSGYRGLRQLEEHYAEAESDLLPQLRCRIRQPMTVSGTNVISRLFRQGEDCVLFLVNWDVHSPAEAVVQVESTMQVQDALSGGRYETVDPRSAFHAPVAAHDWRILRFMPA